MRHRDLNAKQILLAVDGLWLADFGLSKDRAEQSQSGTNNGDKTTSKYHAPEREAAVKQPGDNVRCGKPEDIFALGCIYLEMSHRLVEHQPEGEEGDRAPYHAHLSQLQDWLLPLKTANAEESYQLANLAELIECMMKSGSQDRPRISQVIERLQFMEDHGGFPLFDSCCKDSTY
jgi:serine/threonine protein kinase